MTREQRRDHDEIELLSLRAAAKVAGVPRAYLEECVAAGRLAVHFHQKGDVTKFRVSRSALEAAGLLETTSTSPDEPHETLACLLRDQAARLAAVEEQRFQLAGQLGAALERNRVLEDRLIQLAASSETDQSVDVPAPAASAASDPTSPTLEGADAMPSPVAPDFAAPLTLAKRITGVKPAADWPPRRALGAISRIRFLIKSGARRPSAD